MRRTLMVAVAGGLLVGSAGGAMAWDYSGNVSASVAGHTGGAHAVIQGGASCSYRTEVWAIGGGSWYWGAEATLFRASDNAIIVGTGMEYSGNTTSFKNITRTYNPPGTTNYYNRGKFAIYNGNGYNYWYTNRTPYASC